MFKGLLKKGKRYTNEKCREVSVCVCVCAHRLSSIDKKHESEAMQGEDNNPRSAERALTWWQVGESSANGLLRGLPATVSLRDFFIFISSHPGCSLFTVVYSHK